MAVRDMFTPQNHYILFEVQKLKIQIVFENDQFTAVNKPPGILTIPDRHNTELPSLVRTLENDYGKLYIIHRLDRETSGLILFAKDEATHKYFSHLFEHRNIAKFYSAIVIGTPVGKKGRIEQPIMDHPVNKGMMYINRKGKPSITDYEVLEDYKQFSLVQFQLHTGRTHQIRVHMKHLGNPIACDEVYGNGKPILLSSFKKKFKLSNDEETERPMLARLALHSYKLKFEDALGEEFELTAELPKDMRAVLQQLKKRFITGDD